MSEPEVRTTRSFCRVLHSLVRHPCRHCRRASDQSARRPDHPMSAGYTCAKGRALPAMHHHPRRIEHPMLRRKRVTRAGVVGRLPRRPWHAVARNPRPYGTLVGRYLLRQRSGMDAAGLPHGGSAAPRRSETPARFSPLTIDGTAKVLVATLVGGFPGLNHDRTTTVRASSSTSESTRSSRTVTPRRCRARRRRFATCGLAPRYGSWTPGIPRPPVSRRVISLPDRAPITRSWPISCASCCVTAPTSWCSRNEPSTATALRAAVEPFRRRPRCWRRGCGCRRPDGVGGRRTTGRTRGDRDRHRDHDVRGRPTSCNGSRGPS